MNIDALRDELDAVRDDLGPAQCGPGAHYALFGSTVLLLWGLRDRVGDVDVFVAPPVWTALAHRPGWERRTPDPHDPPYLERELDGYRVHAFYAWTDKDPEVDADQCRRAAELVHGWWCTPLQIIRLHKAMALPKNIGSACHEKHRADVIAIDAHFARQDGLTLDERAELELLRDVAQRLIVFDGGAEVMPWVDRHRHHGDAPYIGCPFCRDRFVLREASDAA